MELNININSVDKPLKMLRKAIRIALPIKKNLLKKKTCYVSVSGTVKCTINFMYRDRINIKYKVCSFKLRGIKLEHFPLGK